MMRNGSTYVPEIEGVRRLKQAIRFTISKITNAEDIGPTCKAINDAIDTAYGVGYDNGKQNKGDANSRFNAMNVWIDQIIQAFALLQNKNKTNQELNRLAEKIITEAYAYGWKFGNAEFKAMLIEKKNKGKQKNERSS